MPDPLAIPIRASTQEHLEIEDIKDDVVLLKNGSCCVVLSVTAINFNLLSEREQEATIYSYAALLNSLTFPTQIVIRSKRKDVTSYLKLLDEEIKKQTNELLKAQMKSYRQFIEEIVKKNNVLDKKFYLVIPFTTMELGVAQTFKTALTKKRTLPYPKDYILERAKMNLYPKRDQVVRQFNRLGLKTRNITGPELIQLYFDIYNRETSLPIIPQMNDLQTPILSKE